GIRSSPGTIRVSTARRSDPGASSRSTSPVVSSSRCRMSNRYTDSGTCSVFFGVRVAVRAAVTWNGWGAAVGPQRDQLAVEDGRADGQPPDGLHHLRQPGGDL